MLKCEAAPPLHGPGCGPCGPPPLHMPGCCAWGPGCPGGPGAKVVKRKSLSFTTRSEDTERGPLTENMMFDYMAQKQSNCKAFSIHLPVLFPCLWVKRLCALESPSRASPLLGSLYLGDKEPAGKQCLESLCVGGKCLENEGTQPCNSVNSVNFSKLLLRN